MSISSKNVSQLEIIILNVVNRKNMTTPKRKDKNSLLTSGNIPHKSLGKRKYLDIIIFCVRRYVMRTFAVK